MQGGFPPGGGSPPGAPGGGAPGGYGPPPAGYGGGGGPAGYGGAAGGPAGYGGAPVAPGGFPPAAPPPGAGYGGAAGGPAGYGGAPVAPGGFPPAAPPPAAGYGGQSGFTPPPGVVPGVALAQPGSPYGVHPQLGIPYSEKSKVAAGLLQLLAGSFGVGRFYTGHTGLAVTQLLVCFVLPTVITVITCGIGAFFYVAALWPMIDGILLLTTDSKDSDGRLLR